MPARKKKTPEYAKSLMLLLSGILIGVLTLAVIFPNKVKAPTSNQEGINEINNTFHTGDSRLDQYFSFKINAPKEYLATTDQMLGSYLLVGGMAPPRLFLNKNTQVLVNDEGDFLSMAWKYNKNDCISIWTAGGLSSVDEWLDLPSLEIGRLGDKEEIKLEKRDAEIYKLSRSDGTVFVGFMPVESEQDVSYFFRTCNENNKQDLINIIKSLRLRIDGGIE